MLTLPDVVPYERRPHVPEVYAFDHLLAEVEEHRAMLAALRTLGQTPPMSAADIERVYVNTFHGMPDRVRDAPKPPPLVFLFANTLLAVCMSQAQARFDQALAAGHVRREGAAAFDAALDAGQGAA